VLRELERRLEVERRDRVRAARDRHRGHVAGEVVREEVRVERRGHEDELEVRAPREHVAQHHQEEVGLDGPLVDLVDEDVRHAL
jgi:hypothetical protein